MTVGQYEANDFVFAIPFFKAHPQGINPEDEPLKEVPRRRSTIILLFRIYSLSVLKWTKNKGELLSRLDLMQQFYGATVIGNAKILLCLF